MPGPRPEPTRLKIIKGNPGKKALNKNEPQPIAVIPPCPRGMSPEAKREWKRIAEKLHRLGLLTEIDGDALEAYCELFARWRKEEKAIRKETTIIYTKTGYPIINPRLGLINKLLQQIKGYLAEFGMSPASRSKVTVEKPKKEKGLEELLK